MNRWWQALSMREKLLVASAGGLLALIVVWYGLVTPSLKARAEARAAYQEASAGLASLERLVAAKRARAPAARGVAVSTGAALTPDAFKTQVTQSAQSAGLSISRLQSGPGSDGNFSLVFEQADPRQLFYWLNELERRLGGKIDRFSIDQASNGRVRATVEVSGGAT